MIPKSKPAGLALQYSAEDIHAAAAGIAALYDTLLTATRQIDDITTRLLREPEALTIEDRWVKEWGETQSKSGAARMLGVSPAQITGYVQKGYLPTTPDGRVLVRDAAQWANSGRPKPKPPRPGAYPHRIK